MPEHFAYAVDNRYLPVLLPFFLRPARDGVTLTDQGMFAATFGLFKIATPRSNISGAHITRNYRWWTAVGVRMSHADDGLTFGTTTTRVYVFTSQKECHRYFAEAAIRRLPSPSPTWRGSRRR